MAKAFDLATYKKSVEVDNVPKKKDMFIELDASIQSVIGCPGIPLGHTTMVYGKSDTGKTTLLFHAGAQAQKQGVLPVFIVTEGKVDWTRAEKMGVNLDKCIINEECNNLEEVFAFIDKITSDVSMGELPMDTLILWDSIGSLPSKDEVIVNPDGTTERKPSMMKAARCIREHMRIISRKVNVTRNISYPKYVGLFILNQAYTKPPDGPYGQSQLVQYGGEGVWYNATFVWKIRKKKSLSAEKNGKGFDFGMVSCISVMKDHINSLAMEGDFIITGDSIFANTPNELKKYKDSHKEQWGEATITEKETGEVLDE
jgi:hypothetical protein